MDAAMMNQKAGEFQKAIDQWKEIAPMYAEDIKSCTDVLDAYNAIKKYQDDVLARPDAKEYLRKKIEESQKFIEKEEWDKINQWSMGSYFVSGRHAADADVYMGIAPKKGELEER